MAGEKRIEIWQKNWLRIALIAIAGAAGLVGCLNADFIAYDDSAHVASPYYAGSNLADHFTPKKDTSYIPVTLLSYKVDIFLHGNWTNPLFGSWAPGVRIDNWLIHIGAALILWRLLLKLKFSDDHAFFIALIFSAHPLACETVCWVSERKNALAALFGFATLYVLTREDRPIWRWPLAALLYSIALLGKPSALGLLPILYMLEALRIIPAFRERFFEGDSPTPSRRNVASSVVGLLSLGLIALICLRLNLYTHSGEIVPPPGGSLFTALLTDLNIVCRYLYNIVLPVNLSAVYFVEPITGLADPRAWLWGGLSVAIFAVTIWLSQNRWRALFGWFWFCAALAPTANIVALVHVMTDRYIYLSTPGFLIVLSEMLSGLRARFSTQSVNKTRPLSTLAATMFVIFCIIMSVSRGYVWRSSFAVFADAAEKQPRAFYAHYGLGGAWYTLAQNAAPQSAEKFKYESLWLAEFTTAFGCPDSSRYLFKHDVAWMLGEYYFRKGDAISAAKYFTAGAAPSHSSTKNETRALSLAYLCLIELSASNTDDALKKAQSSLEIFATDPGRIAFARASIERAKSASPDESRARLSGAKSKLLDVPIKSPHRGAADELLKKLETN